MQQRKPAENRKAEIVSALLVLADRIGPDRLTTNDIAREVGVTQAAIFRHFPTKAALWVAVAEALAARMRAAWQEALTDHATPQARVRALIGAQLRQIEACPALPAVLHSRELNADNAELRETIRGLMREFQGLLVGNLRALGAADGTRAEVDAEDAAVLLISLVQGLAIRWGLGSRSFALETEGLRLLDLQLALFTGQGRGR